MTTLEGSMNHVVYVHARDPENPRAGVCHALEVNTDNNVIAIGTAVCSPRDNYNKRIGRTIAASRLGLPDHRAVVTPTPVKDAVALCLTAAKALFAERHAVAQEVASLRSALKLARAK